ncbi:MAG: hypothetical protein IV108_00760 [Burkholderiales bacterium]|nr:hypothetical protein [Burkholderiales bacterium]
MTELQEIQTLFTRAAQAIESRFTERGMLPSDVSPGQLVEALSQLLFVFDKLDRENGEYGPLPYDDPGELGEHGVNIAADLATWAERLELSQAKADVEKVAVGVALWVVRHEGEIHALDTIVNGFASEANTTASEETLRVLYRAMQLVLEHTAAAIKQDLDKTNPGRPWRALNFNFAIVATRTQDAQLMHEAFDTLSRNLPEDAPAFFEEGLRQSDKPVYGPIVKSLMQEYFTRWTVRH